ncbi:hypothetical protein DHD32_10245 [Arenibacter sp. TNZ]|uniref:hypothetical protein n=1 Tax=Arenibacter TaxID=178469 RepID=UPI000CD46888|nr:MULTISPECIES: hypothetical protein [Arenibacter]MCM4171862.1 hypothetical protein [Arenibacter sp. TNZ]
MKNIFMLGLLLLIVSNLQAQCEDYQSAMSDVLSYADDCSSYVKKAYNANNLEDAQYYAKIAMNSADDAMSSASDAQSYASDCDCDDGENYASNARSNADDAYSYAKKAYNADKLEDAQYYAKKAKSSAEDCEGEASSGEYECD